MAHGMEIYSGRGAYSRRYRTIHVFGRNQTEIVTIETEKEAGFTYEECFKTPFCFNRL